MARFIGGPKFQAFDSNGNLLEGGLVYTYVVGTTTDKATYPTVADALAKTNANTNPVVLDSRGEANIVLGGNTKLVLKDSLLNTIWTVDNINEDSIVLDASGNEIVVYSSAANAVNYLSIKNAATGGYVTVDSLGSDATPGLLLQADGGTGVLQIKGSTVNITGTGSIGLLGGTTVVGTFGVSSTATITGTLTASGAATITGTLTASGAATVGTTLGVTGLSTLADTTITGTLTLPQVISIPGTAGNPGALKLLEDSDNGTNYVQHQSVASVTANRTVTWPDTDISGFVVQRVSTQTGAVATGTTIIPLDDTIPQNTEGTEFMTLAITPKSTSNILVIDVMAAIGASTSRYAISAIFQDLTASALAANSTLITTAELGTVVTRHIMTAGTTSSTTFKVRIGPDSAATLTFNGSAGARLLGGVSASSIMITEYSA